MDQEFFKKIVDYANKYQVYIIHDFAYADLVFDDYKAPSFLQVPGAKEVGVELFSLSKSYNMPGWRMGFVVGNQRLVHALTRIKSYLDYGVFQPIQIASIIALNGPYDCVEQTVAVYKERRDALCRGLHNIGWRVEPPKGTMFVWARIPRKFRHLGSVEFSMMMIREAKVAVAPGLGFGEFGDEYVRFALVENVHRTNQAIRGFRQVLKKSCEELGCRRRRRSGQPPAVLDGRAPVYTGLWFQLGNQNMKMVLVGRASVPALRQAARDGRPTGRNRRGRRCYIRHRLESLCHLMGSG